MRKLARALTLVAMLAAMHLAAMTTAHAYPADPATDHWVTAQRSTGDATARLLARERSSIPNLAPAQATGPMRPAEQPSGQAARLAPALGVVAAVLALLAGAAVVATRRANRSHRAAKPA